jgi:predicted Zn-dependent peptidase
MKLRFCRTALTGLALVAVLAPEGATQVTDYRKIKYPPLPDFKIAKPEVYTLENGMTVFLIEDHELPLISVQAQIRTGSNYEPKNKVGLAEIMADVQRSGGTARMTGDEIDEYLAVRAASVETGMGGSAGFASMNSLTDAFDDTFAVFADVLRTPAFSQDKLDVAKIQTNAGIARRNDNIGGITGREFSRLMYGADSPLSWMAEYETVAAVERADLVSFHEKYYHPNNVYLGVVGDFDSAVIKGKIKATFGDWKAGPALELPAVAFQEPKPGVYFVEKSDVNQAHVRLGHLGIEQKNPDYFAVQVLNEVFGGGFAGRLMQVVRSDKGLAYSVFGGVGAEFNYPGVFQTGLQTKSETMAESVEALKAEIAGIIDNPPSEEELRRAKESILNSFVFRYDSRGEILSQQMTYAYYGLPADYLETYRAKIEKVTAADVLRVAKEYIHPDRVTLLVVGKAEDFDKPVSTFGEVTQLDVTIPPPPDTTPAVVKTAASLEAGARLMAEMSLAVGGAQASSIRSLERKGNTVLSMGGQSMSLGSDLLLVFPDKVRMALKTPVGEMTTVLDGKTGFRQAGGRVMDLSAGDVEDASEELARDLAHIVVLGGSGVEAVAAGQEEIDGVPYRILALSVDGVETRMWIAPDGLVFKQAYQGKHPMQRTPGKTEVLYSDYREVEGLHVPHVQVMRFEGQEIMRTVLESVEVNPEVDSGAFAKPPA